MAAQLRPFPADEIVDRGGNLGARDEPLERDIASLGKIPLLLAQSTQGVFRIKAIAREFPRSPERERMRPVEVPGDALA